MKKIVAISLSTILLLSSITATANEQHVEPDTPVNSTDATALNEMELMETELNESADSQPVDTQAAALEVEGTKLYTFSVAADTFCYGGDGANTNNGNATEIYVRLTSAPRIGYMKFAITPIAGYDIIDAKVKFMLNRPAAQVPLKVAGVNVADWDEYLLTYNDSLNWSTSLTPTLDTIIVEEKALYTMDITEYAKNAANDMLTLRFTSEKNQIEVQDLYDRVYIMAKESGTAPYIEIVARPYAFDDSDPENTLVESTYHNQSELEQEAILAACVFDNVGTLTEVKADRQIIEPNSMSKLSLNFSANFNVANNYAKFFLIKSITNPIALRKDFKYPKGISEFSVEEKIKGVTIKGKTVVLNGEIPDDSTADSVGMAVIKPDVDTDDINYDSLLDSIVYIGSAQVNADKSYSLSFSLSDDAPQGVYTAYASYGDETDIIKFRFAHNPDDICDELSKVNTTDELKNTLETNIYAFNLSSSDVYLKHYLGLDNDKRTDVLNNLLPLLKSVEAADVRKIVEEETVLYITNSAATYSPIYNLIEDCADFFNLDAQIRNKSGATESYLAMYNKLYDKTTPAKAVYGGDYESTIRIEDMIKTTILTQYNSQIKPVVIGGGSGGGGGGGGGSYSVHVPDLLTSPAPLPIIYPTPTPTQAPMDTTDSSENDKTFSDLAEYDWAEQDIYALSDKKVIEGFGDGTFNPGANVTREQFVKILIGGLELLSPESQCEYQDVDKTAWYYEYVATSTALNIVKGVDATTFGLGQNITRQDMAVMIYRSAQAAGITIAQQQDINFSDNEEIADYAITAVASLQAADILNGMGEGAFGPASYVNRAQAAVVVSRLIKLLQ